MIAPPAGSVWPPRRLIAGESTACRREIPRRLAGCWGCILALVISAPNGSAQDDWFGFVFDAVADRDGDGIPELLIADPDGNPDHGGSVYLFSGGTGEVLLELDGHSPSQGFGASLLAGVALEGMAETVLVIGETVSFITSRSDRGNPQGRLRFFDFAGAEVCEPILGASVGGHIGWGIAGVVHGLGRENEDALVSADRCRDTSQYHTHGARIAAIGLRSRQVLYAIEWPESGSFVRDRNYPWPRDANGSSLDFLVRVTDSRGAGSVEAVHGATGRLLFSVSDIAPSSPDAIEGASVWPIGDLDGDGLTDLAAGYEKENQFPISPENPLTVRFYSGKDGSSLAALPAFGLD